MAKGAWKRLKCKIRMICCCKVECKRENNISINNNGQGSKTYCSNGQAQKTEKKDFK